MFAPVLLLLALAGCVRTDTATLEALDKANLRTLLNSTTYTMANTQCKEDLDLYFANITSSPWAMKMLDSSAKIPEGLLQGSNYFMGQYDECLSVKDEAINFTGKHCLTSIFPVLGLPPLNNEPQDKSAGPGLIFGYRFGLCVPSSCTGPDIAEALNSRLGDLPLQVFLEEVDCRTSEPIPLRSEDWVVIAFLGFLGLVVLASTYYDVNQRFQHDNTRPHAVMSSFSLYTNLSSLFTISTSGQMGCLHGLRTLSIIWVILGHAYIMTVSEPSVNFATAMAQLRTETSHMPIANGYVSVDSFFFLSGLLVCFVFFRDIGRNGTYDVIMGYIHRYLRLTPPFAAMILLQVTILTMIGDGPLWHSVGGSSDQMCKKSWWSGLLYVQNFVDPHSNCLGQSWYLSADMQMYWISPLLLYPLYLFPVAGTVWLGFAILAAISLNFAIAYVNDLGPGLGISKNGNDTIDYVQFYMRLTPWLIGVALGYIICGIKAKKIQVRLSKLTVLAGWILSTGVSLTVIYGIHNFFEYEYPTVDAALYLALHRAGWALSLAWIVFACIHGYGGPVNVFLSWSMFQPLGKLSYSAFLIHVTVQTTRLGMNRVNTYISDFDVVYNFLADVVITFMFAIPLTCLFEMPFISIERYLFRNVKIFPYPREGKKVKAEEKKDLEVGVQKEEEEKSQTTQGVENPSFMKTEEEVVNSEINQDQQKDNGEIKS